MEAKFIELLKEALECDPDMEINLSDKFRDYDEWDSMGRLSLIAMLDDEFEVEIETADFEKLETVQDLLNEVEKRKAA